MFYLRETVDITTGNSEFAVCHRHSATTKKHLAKAAPYMGTIGTDLTPYIEAPYIRINNPDFIYMNMVTITTN